MPTLIRHAERPTPGLLSDRTSGRRVHAGRYRPPQGLEALVEALWTGDWDLRGQVPHEVRMLSDPSVHLVFEAGRSRVVGVWRGLWTRQLAGLGRVRAVKLHPGAAGALRQAQPSQWTDRMTPLTEVFEDAAAMEQAVLAPDTAEEGLAALTAWLQHHLSPPDDHPAAVGIIEQARLDPHLRRVDALAAHAGISVRGLQRLFQAQVGASPKWLLRRFRLQDAADRLQAGADDLADVAYSLGYADQAHFSRDFRAATGMPPSRVRDAKA